jgi:flagellar biogenesis protein FliO
MTTLLLLAAFYGFAWYARRRGWLQRWGAGATPTAAPARRLRVLERLQVSRRTSVVRIGDGESEYLFAETSAGTVQLLATPVATGTAP